MKRLLTALALACVLSVSVLAGDIPSLGTPQPPPQGLSTAPGDMPTGGEPGEVPMVGSDAALSAVLTLLGLAV